MRRTILLVLGLTGLAMTAACSQADLDALQSQLAETRGRVQEFQQTVSDLRDSLETAQRESAQLQVRLSRLTRLNASGGGVNLKMMPDPQTGEATVPMEEVFSFDSRHAMCRVETNHRAFKMPTYKMGEVTVEPHQFFMSMVATSIEEFAVKTLEDGSRQVTMQGGLDCATEVGQAEITLGSRTAAEPATYRVTAIDKGLGGGDAGDSFAFTVFFDKTEAPVNYAIFGPEFTFTGQMVSGEVTVIDPTAE